MTDQATDCAADRGPEGAPYAANDRTGRCPPALPATSARLENYSFTIRALGGRVGADRRRCEDQGDGARPWTRKQHVVQLAYLKIRRVGAFLSGCALMACFCYWDNVLTSLSLIRLRSRSM